MAMTMKGEVELPATRDIVWTKLNDPDVLKACIPGCESLEKTSDTSFVAVAKNKIGPVSATFKGRVELLDLDPPNGYRIQGEGDGGIAGFAKGGARVALEPSGAGTKLIYDVEAQVGGKIAQLGARLIDGVAKKLADQFFQNFAAAVASPAPAPALEATDGDKAEGDKAAGEKKGFFGHVGAVFSRMFGAIFGRMFGAGDAKG